MMAKLISKTSYCVTFKLDAMKKSNCKKDIESNSVLCDLVDSNVTDCVTDVVVAQSQTVRPQSTHSTFSDRLMYSALRNRLKSSVLISLAGIVQIQVSHQYFWKSAANKTFEEELSNLCVYKSLQS